VRYLSTSHPDRAAFLVEASSEDAVLALARRVRDPELELEGRVYDLIHRVNTMRKDAGLELTDRIALTLPEDDADLLEHSDWIARETLATAVDVEGPELRLAKS
jgi:isoleucyl-tRNA synthetase